MRKFKIGVIGAGAVAQAAHIPGFAAADNCELTAIADPERRCLDEVAAKGWRFKSVYSDYKQMLRREQLDAVSIATPNALHKRMAIDCIRHGCDILLEKPVAVTLAQAEAIRAAAEKHGARIMVAFSHRFHPYNVKARQALEAGRIGDPFTVRARFSHTGPDPGWAKTDWFYNPKLSGGGAMLDMAIHAIDLLQWYLGPITAVHAKVATLRKPIAVDDTAILLLEFARPCLAYVEVGWTSPAGYCGLEFMGDSGAIFVDYRRKVTLLSGQVKPDGTCDLKTAILADDPGGGPWPRQMAHFTRQLGRRGPFCVGIAEGISALKVALAAYRSSRTGRRMPIR